MLMTVSVWWKGRAHHSRPKQAANSGGSELAVPSPSLARISSTASTFGRGGNDEGAPALARTRVARLAARGVAGEGRSGEDPAAGPGRNARGEGRDGLRRAARADRRADRAVSGLAPVADPDGVDVSARGRRGRALARPVPRHQARQARGGAPEDDVGPE